MATIADLVQDILTHTGQSGLVFLVSQRETFVNNAILRMERRHHFRGQQVTLDPLLFPANADFIPVPPDFVTERGLWQKNTQTDPSRALVPITAKTLRRFWIEATDPANQKDSIFPAVANPSAGQTPGGSFYYIWNRGLYLVPSPSISPGVTLVLDYIRIVPDLTGDQENWFTRHVPDVVRAGAVAEAYRFLVQPDAAQLWEQTFEARLTDAIRQDETLSLSGPPSSRGRGDN